MHSLPIFLDLHGRKVLVVGGGRLAARRVPVLLAAGANITLVARQLTPELSDCVEHGDIRHLSADFSPELLENVDLAFALDEHGVVNTHVVKAARERRLWCNTDSVADGPQGDFLMPAIIDRSPLLIALSTGGQAPALTRLLRVRLEAMVPSAYGRLAALIANFRERVARGRNRHERKQFWDDVLAGPVAEKLFAGRDDEAARDLQTILQQDDGQAPDSRGEVYLVGGGPGAPDLLTFRAMRLMQQADVVLYDSLVSPEIVDLVRADAERIHVGKRASKHTLPQTSINQLMVDLALAGKRVLRLKGGDPFIFGRGGEEIAELAEAGIAFQVVPGITAANGCASYAGIPLTHRDYAQSVQFVTGHRQDGVLDLDWPRLAAPQQTLVFFMGRGAIAEICEHLRRHGLPDEHPAALVVEGTTLRQRVLASTLASLPGQVASEEITAPSLIIVGEVVRLNASLGWFSPEAGESA